MTATTTRRAPVDTDGSTRRARREARSRKGRRAAPDPNPLGLPYDQGRKKKTKPPLRHRILPRTVIGITVMLLALAVGAAFAGAVLYAYYDWRLSQNEDAVGDLVRGFDQRYETAAAALQAQQDEATAQIRNELAPLQALVGESTTISQLAGALSPSVWFVATLDAEGRPSVGTAFVVASDETRSLMVTSHATVAAATVQPGPEIKVRKGGEEIAADLWTWHPERDLALLVVPKPGLPALPWASEETMAQALGSRVYAVTGLGGVGAALSPGFVVDQSTAGIQHTAAVGAAYQGGPLVNSEGQVLGVASRTYSPLGFDPGTVTFAPPVTMACEVVLSCGGGTPQLPAEAAPAPASTAPPG